MSAIAGDPAVAARTRVEALLERLARVELQVVVVAPPDAIRLAARDRARDVAIVAGRGQLLDEAMAAVREAALRAFSGGGFSGTWAATEMAASVATSSDRVAAAAAFEEAAMAAVVEDLVSDETLEVLRSTSNELESMTGMPSPGSLSAVGAPSGFAIRGPVQVGIVVLVATFLVLLGFGAASILTIALGFAILAGLARRRSRPDS